MHNRMHIALFFFASMLAAFAGDYKVAGLDQAVRDINKVFVGQVDEVILHQEVHYRTDSKGAMSSIYGIFNVGCAGGVKKELNLVFSGVSSTSGDQIEKDLVASGYSTLGLQDSIGTILGDRKLQFDLGVFVIKRIRAACYEPENKLFVSLRLWENLEGQRQISSVKVTEVLFQRLK